METNMDQTATYGFVGLGHQGTPMAQRMIAEGLRPWLWARREEVLDRYGSADAQIAASPSDLGAACDVIGLCLYDADATEAVLFSPHGLMERIRPGTVIAIHATAGPGYVVDLALRAADRGVRVVDAPVSGGDAALERKLLVMVGGEDEAIAACRPMFDTYAGRVVAVGGVGAAQAAKLVNNSLMTAITGLVFDAFEMGRRFGVDRAGLGEVLANGSAANPSVGVYLDLGAEEFAIRAWPTLHKDLDLAEGAVGDGALARGLLLHAARGAIAEMERLRGGYVAARDAANSDNRT
jgi:3-hydroxyisobutyrate dehydrogenase